jgi:hypothetical protein
VILQPQTLPAGQLGAVAAKRVRSTILRLAPVP